MATIDLEHLRASVNEQAETGATGTQVLHLYLGPRPQGAKVVSLEPALAGKTLTYEGYNATVVLDFDELGYLTSIEFV